MLPLTLALTLSTAGAAPETSALYPVLQKFADARLAEHDAIPADRKRTLTKLALWIRTQLDSGETPRLVFICTHNSRRSHISELWSRAAAAVYGIAGVQTFSGGTEATAFNPRAVAAMERAGFEIARKSEGDNPRYLARYGPEAPPAKAFSKVYSDDPNPEDGFAAVMTCSQADKSCPTVEGAAFRVAIPYEDPKAFDGTPREAEAYDERVAQIGREMLYLFSRVRG